MPIQEIITANIVPVIGLAILFVFALRNTLFDKRQTVLFSITIFVNVVLIAASSLDYAFSQSAVANIYVFRRITSFINFAFSPVIPYLLLLIVRKKRLHWAFVLPLAANFVLCAVSLFVKLVFYITPVNTYVRGVMFFFPFLVIAFYLAFLIVFLGASRSKSRVSERFFIFAALVVLVAAILLEVQYGYRFIVWSSTAMILILYYLFLNLQNLLIDSLTGAYNRQTYQREIENMNHKESGYLALIDINDFKAINDLYGHDEGDRKLIKFVEILHKNLSGIAKVYRIGGDEFVLISKRAGSESFLKALESVRRNAERYGLRFAVGVIEYSPADDIKDVMRQADTIMYANKTEQKSALKNK